MQYIFSERQGLVNAAFAFKGFLSRPSQMSGLSTKDVTASPKRIDLYLSISQARKLCSEKIHFQNTSEQYFKILLSKK